MKHLISQVAVRFPVEGEPIIDLLTGNRPVGSVRFSAEPIRRADLPAEVDQPFTLHFPTPMLGLVLDLLRSGADVEVDRVSGELSIGRARARG